MFEQVDLERSTGYDYTRVHTHTAMVRESWEERERVEIMKRSRK